MTSKENRRTGDMKAAIVDRIVAARVRVPTLKNAAHKRRFLQQYVSDIPVDDLIGRKEAIIARAALDHLSFGARRRRGQALLRIFNPTEESHGYTSDFTFVEMVNDDMPFLVDSVAAAINRHDLAVHITVHPVIGVLRDRQGKLTGIAKPDDDRARRESYIRFAIDRESDPSRLKILQQEIGKVLGDVRVAVRDWKKMRARMSETRDLLKNGPKDVDPLLRAESQALLDWMVDDHFTFLGYREYRLGKRGKRTVLNTVDGTGLGVLSRDDRGSRSIELTAEMKRLMRSKDWLILTKANSRATVHRPAFLDYVGVKIYDEKGNAVGERRFIGLLTSIAYSQSPSSIPLLRHKVQKIFERANVDAGGHRGKALAHIIDTYPREELFQSTVQDLARTTIGILNMQDRKRVKFFLRRDTFRRFFSCLVYVPREKYTTSVRQRVENLLCDTFDGIAVDSAVQISDSALARVHIIVRTTESTRPRISIHKIEQQIAAMVVTWRDRLRTVLGEEFGLEEGRRLYTAYNDVFPAGYQDDTSPLDACSDIRVLEKMRAQGLTRSVNLYRPDSSPGDHANFVVYSHGDPITLSDVLPVLENMGMLVNSEKPHEATLQDGQQYWIQDFRLQHKRGATVDVAAIARRFENCFMATLNGDAENDGLNRLVACAGLRWREAALFRCYTKHILQLGLPFSQAYMEDVLESHAKLVQLLTRKFELQFDPAIPATRRKRELKRTDEAVARGVTKARNVDEDRILSAFAGGIEATLRTNYYLRDNDAPKRYISIKLDPARLPEVPLPKPKYEIFVYSPEVEGVHLRGGDIARGGLRWSDRREDFRTEVLGLMKAQVVKNTVIVPSGAKGGFVPKRPPAGDRDAILKNGVQCYKNIHPRPARCHRQRR